MIKHTHTLRSITTPDGAAILDPTRGTLTTLNPTGGYIWQALNDGVSEEEIVENLVRDSGAKSEMVTRDVRGFIASLHGMGLLPL